MQSIILRGEIGPADTQWVRSGAHSAQPAARERCGPDSAKQLIPAEPGPEGQRGHPREDKGEASGTAWIADRRHARYTKYSRAHCVGSVRQQPGEGLARAALEFILQINCGQISSRGCNAYKRVECASHVCEGSRRQVRLLMSVGPTAVMLLISVGDEATTSPAAFQLKKWK